MEIEAPAPVVVGVALAPDRHRVRVATGKGHPQGDAKLAVDEQVVTLGPGYVLYRQAHLEELAGDREARFVVFVLAVHLSTKATALVPQPPRSAHQPLIREIAPRMYNVPPADSQRFSCSLSQKGR